MNLNVLIKKSDGERMTGVGSATVKDVEGSQDYFVAPSSVQSFGRKSSGISAPVYGVALPHGEESVAVELGVLDNRLADKDGRIVEGAAGRATSYVAGSVSGVQARLEKCKDRTGHNIVNLVVEHGDVSELNLQTRVMDAEGNAHVVEDAITADASTGAFNQHGYGFGGF